MNSRLIIKNIPTNISEKELKEHFEQKGDITDVKIIIKNGVHKRICFIGYKSENDAVQAKKYFDNTFIYTSKVKVEYARPVDDPALFKNKGKQGQQQKQEKVQKKQKTQETENTELKEFKDLMKTGAKSTMQWNDVVQKDQENKGISNEEEVQEKETQNKENKPQQIQEQEQKVDRTRLFVLNLPFNIKQEEVEKLFSKFGELKQCHLVYKDGKFKGFAYVSYENESQALLAQSKLDNKNQFGRILHVKISQPMKEKTAADIKSKQDHLAEKEKSSYKRQQILKMQQRLKQRENWNTLFLNPETIINRVCEIHSIEREQVLDKEQGSEMAVKIATAEAQIIEETKNWLHELNINLDFINKNKDEVEMSDRVILIKNLPYNAKQKEIERLFIQYGRIVFIKLAFNKSICIIEFDNKFSCIQAFQEMSYTKYKGFQMYLEMAPINFQRNQLQLADEDYNEEQEDEVNQNILYVKNLNFETTEQMLQTHFEDASLSVKSTKIIFKNKKSQGYGFVEFFTMDDAIEAIKKLQNSLLDGHVLQLSISKKNEQTQKSQKRIYEDENEATSKILIKNIPFEATKKEISQLIKNFAQVKSIRLPKKVGSKEHRGFVFVEFNTVEEAKQAFEKLQHVHFYGRKFVLLYTNAVEDLN